MLSIFRLIYLFVIWNLLKNHHCFSGAGGPGTHGHHPQQPAAAAGGGGLFSSIKGYSGSIFKNIKDTSSKVMQTVSQ